jgi:hypothetical protein
MKAMSKLFIRRLIDRHPPSKDADATEETVAFAVAGVSLEILLRAARSCQIAPVAPGVAPSREQLLSLVFGSMCSIGIVAEVAHEGVMVSARAAGTACAITFLPTHPKAERIQIGAQVSKIAAALAQASPMCFTTVGRLAVVIVRETPARLPTESLHLADGKPVDEMLEPLMRTLLTATFDLPAD